MKPSRLFYRAFGQFLLLVGKVLNQYDADKIFLYEWLEFTEQCNVDIICRDTKLPREYVVGSFTKMIRRRWIAQSTTPENRIIHAVLLDYFGLKMENLLET